MSIAALPTLTNKSKPSGNSSRAGLVLRRKCACGSPTSSLTGECPECKSKKRLQTKLRIGASDDPQEREADRVANQVVGNDLTASPSVASLTSGQLQRQEAAKRKTDQEKYQEGLEKLGEAFLKTPLGKELMEKIKQDALVKGAAALGKDFISTWQGKIVTSAAATGTVAALAATHKELPAQIPEIPLDFLTPGLSVQLSYKGPVDKPTEAMITFKFTEQAPKTSGDKKPLSASEKYRAETARMAADMAKFRAGMTYPPGSPEDLRQKAEQEATKQVVQNYSGGPDIAATIKKYPWLATPQPKSGPQLTLPKPSFGIQPPLLFGDPFELKLSDERKKKSEDEPELQKKLSIGASHDPLEQEADRVADQVMAAPAHSAVTSSPPRIQRHSGQASGRADTAPASVDRVLASSGRPLEPALRRDMEQRFGHDFSRVRIHSGAAAEESAREVNAKAYTVGHNIVFGAGQFSPGSQAGRHLIAHELTHALQQSRAAAVVQRDPAGSDAPKGEAPFFGMEAAPEALSGIQLAFKVKTIPHADGMRFDQSIARPPYSIKTYTREGDNGGPPVIVYYNVVRTEPGRIGPTLWTEYFVGPDAIVKFLAEAPSHAAAASMSYMFGPPAPNSVEAARFVEAVMAGEGREAAAAYGSSLYESVTDPGWWVQMLSGAGSMFEAPAVAVTPRPPPTLRLVPSQPARAVTSVVGRSTAVRLPAASANALEAVATEAPRAVLALVPAPAAEVATAPLLRPAPLIPKEIAAAVIASISASRGKVAAPSTKSKSENEEDRKTGDACQRRLGLRPGINARWHVQRPPVNGQTTVLAAAFRLDKGITLPPGQDTTGPSRDWIHAIGRPADDAGHVIGNRFGGQASFNATDGNIFPQDLSFNRGTMVSYDKVIAQKHAEGCDVCANIGLIYDSGTSLRPSASLYTYFWRSVGAKDFNPPVSALVPNR